MANDVNCPMCGKANPAGSVTCQFCGARIVPLGSSAPTPSVPTPEDDTEGWLRRLRGETPAEIPPTPQAPASPPSQPPAEPAPHEEEVPDWLVRIRERSRAEKSEPEEEPAAEPGSDWLTSPSPVEKATPAAGEGDDWLDRLRMTGEAAQEPPALSPAPVEPAPTPAEPAPAESNLNEPTSSPTPDQLRDWLRSLEGSNSPASEPADQQEQAEPAEQPTDSGNIPDWLRDFETEIPAAPIDTIPNPESGNISGAQPAQPEIPLSIPPAGQVPDWLAAFENPEAPTESGNAVQAGPTTPPQPFTPEEPQAAAAGPFVSDQSEWSQPPAGEGPAIQSEPELPDWLRNVASKPSTARPETPASAETPAWLAAFDTGTGETPAPAGTAGPEGQPPVEPVSPFTGEDLPQWLSEKPAVKETSQPAAPAPQSGLGEEGVASLPEKLTLGEEELPSLPDWLGEAQTEEATPAETPVEGLEPAQLPGWLEAMRPVELAASKSAAESEDNQRVERAGPLVGLRGLLAVENLVTQYQKPPTISVKLRVTDNQRINASLLESILAEETQPKPVRKERARASQTLVRLLVALFLIAVVAITLFSGGLPAGLSTPTLYPSETVAFNSLINNLPDGAPVLLAFDYETGLSGEMNVTAAPVIDQLLAKQARLVIVSTIPAGPVLGQQLIAAAAQKQPGYSLADKTVNLGYLAGGATSLQEYALNPKQAAAYALDSTITGVKAWDSQALLGVNSLQDFACIIVLTDNSETGRAWVEQVQTLLPNTPMLMVTSAQAAPVIQPYYESLQVKGMVAGLAGGMTYEQLRQASGAAHAYWGAFQVGLLTAMFFILIGILFQGILALFPPSKTKREA